MSSDSGRSIVPLLPSGYRASGVLLHVTSLPSPYGIGDLGSAAFSWIDRLHSAGQRWWQMLPLGPTGYGNSPYQSMSSFAVNPGLISPDILISEGLLKAADCRADFPSDAVDYDAVIPYKARLLSRAWENFKAGVCKDLRADYDEFRSRQEHWLDDYALFEALKIKYHGRHYLEWPEELVKRRSEPLNTTRQELADPIDQVSFAQFLLFRQTDQLKEYAHSKDVRLIGDLPFFVSPDSSDVWANPEFFLLDEHRRPRFVAGVPPDYFSANGQLWGNPVYNWDALRATGYRWSIDRLRALLAHVDAIRLDHFRGFAAAWHIPAGAPTAQSGQWVAGPGSDFFQAVQEEIGSLPFIAEDLGFITPDVHALRNQFQLPGTRVLQFAFDGHSDNPYLPANFVTNTVAYTGTHDNAPTREWYEQLPEYQRQNFWNYLKRMPGASDDVAPSLVTLAWSSIATLTIAPLQDLLNLGTESRMNIPGSASGNWRWRSPNDLESSTAFLWLRELTELSQRVEPAKVEQATNLDRSDVPSTMIGEVV
ncbi:MAG TPA: 4-alpha-glucanotransferase [Verrucomicrobiae bacterium]|jgi:4-alpha-glucanotransferase|nr:4-alpha-glucanotransferase [Verrucomicrobiae bacterium]